MHGVEPVDVWLVEGRTGCSCCSDENFFAGPFVTEEEATTWANSARDSGRLASQYAPKGVWYVQKEEGEQLPDGRIIIEDRVWGPEIQEKLSW